MDARSPSSASASSGTSPAFGYSDGDAIEERLVELLRAADRVDSAASIAPAEQQRSWPVRYHLSPDRANLVRHLDVSGLDVLEVGAGMGGVSRWLAEHCASLTVVEGSERRLRALAERTRDLETVTAVAERFEHYQSSARFDLVCVFGVLEYAELYFDAPAGTDPHLAFLERARSLLRPGGVLLLAIENRHGIQYWSGAPEDHTGRVFDGLMGYPSAPSARTFSRRGLADCLAAAGFTRRREWLPFPDYKLPTAVIDPRLAALDQRVAVDLACSSRFGGFDGPRTQLFSDALALDGLAEAGLFAEFANSFLVAATATDSSSAESSSADATSTESLDRLTGAHGAATVQPALAWHYARDRARPTLTVFRGGGDGLRVEKRPLDDDSTAPDATPAPDAPGWIALDEPVGEGEFVRQRLVRRLWLDEPGAFEAEIRRFLEAMIERFRLQGSREEACEIALDPVAVDAVPTNARWSDGAFHLFDQEWRAAAPVPASWLVLRSLLPFAREREAFRRASDLTSLGDLYRRLASSLDVGAGPETLERDLGLEVAFQARVRRAVPDDLAAQLRAQLDEPFDLAELSPRGRDVLDTWRRRLRPLAEHNEELLGVIATQTGHIDRTLAVIEGQQRDLGRQGEALERLDSSVDALRDAVETLARKSAQTAVRESSPPPAGPRAAVAALLRWRPLRGSLLNRLLRRR